MMKTTLGTCSLVLALACTSAAEPAPSDHAAASSGDTRASERVTPERTTETSSPRVNALRAERLDAILSGKTHRGVAGESRYALYFAPDGTTRGRMGEMALSGQWTREGEDTFCIEWQSPPLPRGCTYVVWPDGQDATAYDAGSDELRNTIDTLVDGEQTDL